MLCCTAIAAEPRPLEFSFPGILIGEAINPKGPTGVTVFHFPSGVTAAADIRGGSVGSTGAEFGFLHALFFSGGSLFGLEVAGGIRGELLQKAGNQVRWDTVPLVAGAIIWDYNNRETPTYPDQALGRAALRSARAGHFTQGRAGAGIFAAVGQGGAYRRVGDLTIAVFTVVNSLGRVVSRNGQILTHDGESAVVALERKLRAADKTPGDQAGNVTQHTTLTLVAVNASNLRLDQLARQVHTSMSRAIQPFHTEFDGDILWAVSTGAIETGLNTTEVGILASELAWDAVLSSVSD